MRYAPLLWLLDFYFKLKNFSVTMNWVSKEYFSIFSVWLFWNTKNSNFHWVLKCIEGGRYLCLDGYPEASCLQTNYLLMMDIFYLAIRPNCSFVSSVVIIIIIILQCHLSITEFFLIYRNGCYFVNRKYLLIYLLMTILFMVYSIYFMASLRSYFIYWYWES